MIKLSPALVSLAIAAIIWGATVPIMKITLREVPIFSLIVIRMACASVILLPFVYKKLHIEKEDFRNVFLSAVFGTNLNLAFFFYGIENTQVINGSVLLATTPIFTLFFAHIFLREKLTLKLITGALLAFLGTLVIVGTPVFNLDVTSTVGNISLLLSTLAWVAHEIFAKKVLKKYHFLTIAFYTAAIGATLFFPLALMEVLDNPTWYLNLSTSGVVGLLYGIVFASTIAYTAWQKGLQNTTASQASFVFYLLPLFGIIFSIILLDESFNRFLLIGTILISAGIVLAEYHRKKHYLKR